MLYILRVYIQQNEKGIKKKFDKGVRLPIEPRHLNQGISYFKLKYNLY